MMGSWKKGDLAELRLHDEHHERDDNRNNAHHDL